MKCDRRWWNDGRYAAECIEFDAACPLWNEVWTSLRRSSHEQACRLAGEPWWGPSPLGFIRARTENGLEIRIKLDVRFPMHIGIASLA